MSQNTLLVGQASRNDGSERGKPRPACEVAPEDFDLDNIWNKLDDIYDAVNQCQACPILQRCTSETEEYLRQGLKVQCVVQAGYVWPALNSPKLSDEIRAELRRRGLLGTKKRFVREH